MAPKRFFKTRAQTRCADVESVLALAQKPKLTLTMDRHFLVKLDPLDAQYVN